MTRNARAAPPWVRNSDCRVAMTEKRYALMMSSYEGGTIQYLRVPLSLTAPSFDRHQMVGQAVIEDTVVQ